MACDLFPKKQPPPFARCLFFVAFISQGTPGFQEVPIGIAEITLDPPAFLFQSGRRCGRRGRVLHFVFPQLSDTRDPCRCDDGDVAGTSDRRSRVHGDGALPAAGIGARTVAQRMRASARAHDPEDAPSPWTRERNDRWFQHIAIITSDMDRRVSEAPGNKVKHASSGPAASSDWNKNAGESQRSYSAIPMGTSWKSWRSVRIKGNEKWIAQTRAAVFGNRSHGLVISSTDDSLRFYRDVSGPDHGQGANDGTERGASQQRVWRKLAHHFAARRQPGPRESVLEYLTPSRTARFRQTAAQCCSTGKPGLGDRRWHKPAGPPGSSRSRFVSTGVVDFAGAEAEFRKSIVVPIPTDMPCKSRSNPSKLKTTSRKN